MTTEDRLRDLLRDPRWSLPAWPDPHARVRRAARRQRLALAGIGAAVTAVITAAAVVPIMLLGPGQSTVSPEASSGPAPGPFATPPVGAVGFTTAVYPAAVQAQVVTRWLRLCPSTSGLQALGRNGAVATLTVLRQAGRPAPATVIQGNSPVGAIMRATPALSYAKQLRLTDRAFWPQIASGSGVTTLIQAVRAPVLYSGPLRSYHSAGPPGLAGVVAAGCGSRVVTDTWVIVSGRAANPARAAETFFLKRRGHVLLYNAT
jgi:hypothetical protein